MCELLSSSLFHYAEYQEQAAFYIYRVESTYSKRTKTAVVCPDLLQLRTKECKLFQIENKKTRSSNLMGIEAMCSSMLNYIFKSHDSQVKTK